MPPTHYNGIAGTNLERLAAPSDGIFGAAMTLLGLDLQTPIAGAIHGEHDLQKALIAITPSLGRACSARIVARRRCDCRFGEIRETDL